MEGQCKLLLKYPAAQLMCLNSALQCSHKVVTINWLLDEIVRSPPQSLYREIMLTMAGNKKRGDIWSQFFYLLQQRQSVHTRHLNISYNGIIVTFLNELERF